MAKVKPYQMSALDRGMLFSRLCLAMTLLSSVEEAKEFLIDLLTSSESLMLARRIKIAELLLSGKSYREIREELGVGIGTISNVQQWLEAGSGRFRTVLKQIFKEEKRQSRRQSRRLKKSDPYRWHNFKSKYPPIDWPIDLFDEIEPIVQKYYRKAIKKSSVKKMVHQMK